jgi:hypothetical protein
MMRLGDWIQIAVMALVMALVFLGLAYGIMRDARSVGGRLSRRAASGLVMRRVLRGSDRLARWN